MKRRKFITLLGGAAAAWPLAARAQQPAKTPVVGFLNGESRSAFGHRLDTFRRGLAEGGYVDGQNVIIEYRWAEGQYDRVPALAADLVHRNVSVVVANYPPVLEAKKATDTIPIIFTSAADPVEIGLIASLNRPGANITGIYLVAQALEAKRLDLLNKLVTASASIGVLVNPKFRDADRQLHELQDAAIGIKRQIQILRATNNEEIDTAFAAATQPTYSITSSASARSCSGTVRPTLLIGVGSGDATCVVDIEKSEAGAVWARVIDAAVGDQCTSAPVLLLF